MTTPRRATCRPGSWVADIPRTKSGKIVELAVRNVVHGRAVKNVEGARQSGSARTFPRSTRTSDLKGESSMANLRFLGISGSLRRQSCNSGLLRCAAKSLPAGVDFEVAGPGPTSRSSMPTLRRRKPAGVARDACQMGAADALVLACPEYNYSIAPALEEHHRLGITRA